MGYVLQIKPVQAKSTAEVSNDDVVQGILDAYASVFDSPTGLPPK